MFFTNNNILFTKYIAVFLLCLCGFTACLQEPIDSENGTPIENFELLWTLVDENYCYLEYKDVNWDSIKYIYCQKIYNSMSDDSLFNVCGDMLSELKDGHVNLQSSFNMFRYADWYLDYPQNFDQTIVDRNYLGSNRRIVNSLHTQKIDSVGYIRYGSFVNPVTTQDVITALKCLGDIRGLIIDIRNNTGGLIEYSKIFASAFVQEKVIYGYHRYREGKEHSNFSDYYAQYLSPSDSLAFSGNIVLLTNRMVYSAANDFASAMCMLNNTTLIGDKTGGGGGAPFTFELYNGWEVNLSNMILYNQKKEHIEWGIEPDYYIDMNKDDQLKGIDSIIEFAITYLKEKSHS